MLDVSSYSINAGPRDQSKRHVCNAKTTMKCRRCLGQSIDRETMLYVDLRNLCMLHTDTAGVQFLRTALAFALLLSRQHIWQWHAIFLRRCHYLNVQLVFHSRAAAGTAPHIRCVYLGMRSLHGRGPTYSWAP